MNFQLFLSATDVVKPWRRAAINLETAVGWFEFGENRCIIIGIMRDLSHPSVHLAGEQPPVEDKGPPQGVSLDSFAGPVHVEWDTEAALTPLGQLPFFILETAVGWFEFGENRCIIIGIM